MKKTSTPAAVRNGSLMVKNNGLIAGRDHVALA